MEITFQQIKENTAQYISEFGVHNVQEKCCVIKLNGSSHYFNDNQKLVKENDIWTIKNQ